MTKFETWLASSGTLRTAARRLGVSHVTILNWKNGKRGMSRRNRNRLSPILSLRPNDLLILSSKKKAPRC